MNSERFSRIQQNVFLYARRFFGVFGILTFFMLLLSFTDLPYNAYFWLGTSGPRLPGDPGVIVLLGGAGMPSPDGLIRTYYTAEAANRFKQARIIIALPYSETDSLYQLQLMKNELIQKGIDSVRVSFEPMGFNTRSQAVNIFRQCRGNQAMPSLLIITSPEHMYRSIKTFTKAGFTQVSGISTFEKPLDHETLQDRENTKDPRIKNLALRYNMWSYLNYELLVMRETCAIAYYKLKGWI